MPKSVKKGQKPEAKAVIRQPKTVSKVKQIKQMLLLLSKHKQIKQMLRLFIKVKQIKQIRIEKIRIEKMKIICLMMF